MGSVLHAMWTMQTTAIFITFNTLWAFTLEGRVWGTGSRTIVNNCVLMLKLSHDHRYTSISRRMETSNVIAMKMVGGCYQYLRWLLWMYTLDCIFCISFNTDNTTRPDWIGWTNLNVLTHICRSPEGGSALGFLVSHIRKLQQPVGHQETGIDIEIEFSDESIMANRRQLGSHPLENCMGVHKME